MGRTAGLVVVALAVAAGVAATRDDPGRAGEQVEARPRYERVAVIWESIEVSPDRRTVAVVTSFPLGAFCVKQPDGVDVWVEGEVARVAAWMRGPDLPQPPNSACSDECGQRHQSVTLPEPLPRQVTRFEPVAGALPGCW